ncbi:response regulator transcription factor [Nonomuraea maheshkhaliensis]|uniref:Response regulator transcription factor n=1 Tax=Nonomuraea maheshkhaliensis TaxID=419590 RepID=A0ABP4REX5_9ACTN
MIRVLIADDQALLRGSFRLLIDSEDDLTVVGEAGDGREAVALARTKAPDVVLMDVRMPEMDGIAATGQIAGDTRVLILTTFDLDEYVYAALRAGASGFLLKDAPPDDLLKAIRVVASGETLLAPTVTTRLIAEFVHRPLQQAFRGLDSLTDREREVLTLVAHGLSNAELSTQLKVSPGTVKTHIGRLLAKLNARDRAQLVIAAYEAGLVTPRSANRPP